MTRKEIILQMFLTQYNILSDEIDELQRNLRYRRITTTDCLELIIALERFQMLKDMQRWIFSIMRIDEDSELEQLFRKFESEQKKKVTF